MRLDMTMTLGNVIQIVVMVGALFMVYTAIRERLVRIETQIGPLVEWWNHRAARRHDDDERTA